MLLDTRIVLNLIGLVLAVVAGIILIKVITVFFTVRLLRFDPKSSLLAAFGLAQVGEFSFVLANVGRENGFLAGQDFQVFIASSILTILATPLLVELGPRLADRVGSKYQSGQRPENQASNRPFLSTMFIIAGFGLNGQNLARVLKETGTSLCHSGS